MALPQMWWSYAYGRTDLRCTTSASRSSADHRVRYMNRRLQRRRLRAHWHEQQIPALPRFHRADDVFHIALQTPRYALFASSTLLTATRYRSAGPLRSPSAPLK
jgi:hypothetical protein